MAKHSHISRELRNEIAAGVHAESGKLSSEAQLVERFNVSRPTAARALRDLQNAGIIERRVGSGSFVKRIDGLQLNSKVLGLLVPERSTTEVFEAICGEIGVTAAEADMYATAVF